MRVFWTKSYINQDVTAEGARFFELQCLAFEVFVLREEELGLLEDLLVFVLLQGGQPCRLFAVICQCWGSNSNELLITRRAGFHGLARGYLQTVCSTWTDV